MALKNNEPSGDVTDVIAKPATGAAPESLDNIAREADMLDTSPQREAQAGQVAQVEANCSKPWTWFGLWRFRCWQWSRMRGECAPWARCGTTTC